jgi:hypothetical protein
MKDPTYLVNLNIYLISDVHPDPEVACSRELEMKEGFTREFLEGLHAQVKDGVAPPQVKDLMSALTVFGKGNKRLSFMKDFIEALSDGAKWVEMLDLTHTASETKYSYGHELVRGRPGDSIENSWPLLDLIRSNGYFEHSRQDKRQGILCSLLNHANLQSEGPKALQERKVLSEVLDNEAKNPGSHLNHWALDQFANCAHQDLVIHMSIDKGIHLMRWQEQISQPSLQSKLSSMQAAVDAQRAIENAMDGHRPKAHC